MRKPIRPPRSLSKEATHEQTEIRQQKMAGHSRDIIDIGDILFP
jgi:hypothetical protein